MPQKCRAVIRTYAADVKSRASGAAKLRERKDLNKAGGKIRIRNLKSGIRMRSAAVFFGTGKIMNEM